MVQPLPFYPKACNIYYGWRKRMKFKKADTKKSIYYAHAFYHHGMVGVVAPFRPLVFNVPAVAPTTIRPKHAVHIHYIRLIRMEILVQYNINSVGNRIPF